MQKRQLCSRLIIIPKFLISFSFSSLFFLSPCSFAFCFVVFVCFRQINVGRIVIKSLITFHRTHCFARDTSHVPIDRFVYFYGKMATKTKSIYRSAVPYDTD